MAQGTNENSSSEKSFYIAEFENNEVECLKAIDDYLDNGIRPKNDEFIIKKSPKILQFAGVSENEIVIRTSVLNKAKNEHSFTNEEIKDAVRNIADPVFVFDTDRATSENKKASVLALTNSFAANKKPIAFAMNLDFDYERNRSIIAINEIRSIHDRTVIAKNGTNLIQKWVDDDRCRYVDDKKITDWQLAAGVQFPLAVLQSDNNNILTKSDFVKRNSPKERLAANIVLEKLSKAGIEVVADKAEFERILARETILQKMQGGLTAEERRRYFTFDEADTTFFNAQIDAWRNDNSNPRKLVIVGNIPPLMKVLGISDNLIEVEHSTLDKMIRGEPLYPNDRQGHKLSVDDIHAIPSQLADPVMVFKSRTRDDSYVFFTERRDENNNSILIPLAVNKQKGRIVINEITSMYGKDNELDFVERNINEKNLIYADEKRSLEWLRDSQVRFLPLKSRDSEAKNKNSDGKLESQVQFLRQRLADIGTDFNILTKERLVNFISSKNPEIHSVQKMVHSDGIAYGFVQGEPDKTDAMLPKAGHYFKATNRQTGELSGFGADDSLEAWQKRWDLKAVECTEISRSEYIKLLAEQTEAVLENSPAQNAATHGGHSVQGEPDKTDAMLPKAGRQAAAAGSGPQDEMEKASEEVVALYMRVSNLHKPYDENIKLKSDYVNDKGVFFFVQDNIAYGFVHGGKIYLNPDVTNSNVLAHEYTHLWDNYTRKANAELWERGKAAFRQTSLWNDVLNDPGYQSIRNDEDEILSECHARVCGKMAQAVLERIAERDGEAARNAAIDWDREVSDYIASELLIRPELGGENYVSESIKAEALKEFLSMPMKDLMNGTGWNKGRSQTQKMERPMGGSFDEHIERMQADGGMSEAAMEAEIAAEENPRPDYLDRQGNPHWLDEEDDLPYQPPFDVVERRELLYAGSGETSGHVYQIRTDDGLKAEIAPQLRGLKENEHLFIEYRKWLNGEENEHDFSAYIMKENEDGSYSRPEDLNTRFNQNRIDRLEENEAAEQFKSRIREYIAGYEEKEQAEDLSAYYERFAKNAAGKTEEEQLQAALAMALDKNVSPLTEVKLNRDNWNKLFPDGTIETPVGTVKLGENQFEKLQRPDRNNLLGAMYETLSNPAIVLEKETLDKNTGEFKPVNVYGKSFVREDSNHKRAVESVVIFKDGDEISIGTHNKDINGFAKQIKTADQVIFADSEISRVASLILQNGGSHVRLQDALATEPLNPNYSKSRLLSIKDLHFSSEADAVESGAPSLERASLEQAAELLRGMNFNSENYKELVGVINKIKEMNGIEPSGMAEEREAAFEGAASVGTSETAERSDETKTPAAEAESAPPIESAEAAGSPPATPAENETAAGISPAASGAERTDENGGMVGKLVPEFAMVTQRGLRSYKDMEISAYDKEADSYVLSHFVIEDGRRVSDETLVVSARTAADLLSERREGAARKFDEETPAYKKMLKAQYDDYFKQRENTANNFRHNFSVYCRKEANNPCDALKVARSLINGMDGNEKKKTKAFLKKLAGGQSMNETVMDLYHEAVQEVPLNEEYLKSQKYEHFIARPFYDTVSASGQRIDKDFNLRIGDKVNAAFKNNRLEKIFSKNALPFAKTESAAQTCRIVSASKEGNSVTLMDGNDSVYTVPRDQFLKGFAKQQKQERKLEFKSAKKNVFQVEY